jgi:hypothetical protein
MVLPEEGSRRGREGEGEREVERERRREGRERGREGERERGREGERERRGRERTYLPQAWFFSTQYLVVNSINSWVIPLQDW